MTQTVTINTPFEHEVTVKLEELVEMAIDQHTLEDVLDAISDVCTGKAEHIVEAWQDRQTAWPWQLAARAIEVATHAVAVREVSQKPGRSK